jgi:endonuclease YncB( thermonuclease family)
MSMDQVGAWFAALGQAVSGIALWLWGSAIWLAERVSADHLEGAAAMAALLLGPSLAVGLARGFWQGLRIEWQQYRGQPRVIDGDTLEIHGERLRLFGLDAPELGQPWWDEDGREGDAGQLAREALAGLIEGRRVEVKVLREDQYRRGVGILKVDGRDVGKRLVAGGWAFAAPGSRRYARLEAAAKRRRKGLWRGLLEMPWSYRDAA